MSEQWRDIPEWIGHYEASDHGRIRHALTEHIRATSPGSHGYPQLTLCRPGHPAKLATVHSLIAAAWLGPRPTPRHEVGHRNDDRTDARASNLEWTTRGDNHRQAYAHGRPVAGAAGQRGEANSAAKLTEARVREIRARVGHDSYRQLAAQHGVTKACIAAVASGRTWQWLDTTEVHP